MTQDPPHVSDDAVRSDACFASVRDHARGLVRAIDRTDGLNVSVPNDLLLRVAAMLDDSPVTYIDADAEPGDGRTRWRLLVATDSRIVYGTGALRLGATALDQLHVTAVRYGDVTVTMASPARSESVWRVVDGKVTVTGHPGYLLTIGGGDVPLPLARAPHGAAADRACVFARTVLDRRLG